VALSGSGKVPKPAVKTEHSAHIFTGDTQKMSVLSLWEQGAGVDEHLKAQGDYTILGTAEFKLNEHSPKVLYTNIGKSLSLLPIFYRDTLKG